MIDPPLTSLPLVALSFSSTTVATSVSDSTLLASLLPLAQCMGLEMGETSRGDVSVVEDASLLRSKELALVVPHLEENPLVEFCGEIVMGSDTRGYNPSFAPCCLYLEECLERSCGAPS